MSYTDQTLSFINNLRWEDLPEGVQQQSKRCLMDALGAMIAGHQTPVSEMMKSFAMEQFPGSQASILVSGEKVSVSGAVLANGFAGNALDIDDGYRPTMGHAGACILPVLLGAAELSADYKKQVSGTDFLTALVVGYEIGTRTGLIRHATYETYHASGSWGAICGAAAAGKLLQLSKEQLQHSLGAAEYHAPIAPMMKCIDTPSMGKDGIGWGALVAIMSVLMAQRGFTGITPLFDDSPTSEWIESLGQEWEIMNLYFKPYSACRWAQPGVDGVLKIIRDNSLSPNDIERITVYTFKESEALSTKYPANTEEAQYNISFPIAAAIIDGEVGPRQNLPPRLFATDIREMMDRVTIVAEDRFQKNFPTKAESEVEIKTKSGETHNSGVMSARWDTHTVLPSDLELEEKFLWLTEPVLGAGKADKLLRSIRQFDQADSLDSFFNHCIIKRFNVEEKTFSNQEDRLTVGIANINSEAGNLESNQAGIISSLKQFQAQNVNIAIFPEYCLSGYFFEPENECRAFMENVTLEKLSPWLATLREKYINETLQMVVLNGLEKVPGTQNLYYDTTLVIDKSGCSLAPERTYRKTFLPGLEKKFCRSGGNDILMLETTWGKLGVLTCYDICFAPLIADLVYNHHIDGLIVTAAWRKQGERSYPDLGIMNSTYHQTQWETILPVLAAQNQIWVMTANSVGPHSIKGLDYCGRSGVWAPSGINMIQGSDSEEQLLILRNIDIQETVLSERQSFGVLDDYNQVANNLSPKITEQK